MRVDISALYFDGISGCIYLTDVNIDIHVVKLFSINFSSLRYRIGLMLVVLSSILVSYILWQTLTFNDIQIKKQLNEIDNVTLDLLSDLALISIFSKEFDSIQSHVIRISRDPRVELIYIANYKNIIIASNNLDMIGETLPNLTSSDNKYWIHKNLDYQGEAHIQFSDDKRQEIKNQTRVLAVKIGGIGLVIIALVGFLLGNYLTMRLTNLTSAVKKYNVLTEDITIDEELLHSKDEVGELARTFKVMHLHIIKYIDTIKIETEERINAQSANDIKSDFMANMSHELRTPLNAIIGYCELLIECPSNQEQSTVEDLMKIHQSGRHLLKLINDILDLSKIESGKVELYYSLANLAEILTDVSKSLYPKLLENKNDLSVNIDPEVMPGYFDEIKIRQILLNLLSNACKFTDSGKIELRLFPEIIDDVLHYIVEVKDNGIGMNEEQCDDVFNPYTQADSSTTRRYGGTGLGLTISKKYCDMMEGSLTVSSVANEGSCFVVTIPEQRSLDMKVRKKAV